LARHNELGKKGEQEARRFLIAKGYTVLETNWRYEKAEIDLIARDQDELVIVEVKTRSTDAFGDPEEAVTPQKARHLIRAAEAYVDACGWDKDIRYDIVSILLKKNKIVIRHIVDAFYAADFQ